MNCVITKPTSVRNMVGIYKLTSFLWCSRERLLEVLVVGSSSPGDKQFLEDLDLFRSECDSVTMFLAPLPDFPLAQIFVVCSAEPGIVSLISME